MESSKFDRLARAVASTSGTTRRSALAGLVSGLLTTLLADGESDAKRGGDKRRSRHGGHRDNAHQDRNGTGAAHKDGAVGVEKKKKKKKKPCPAGTTRCGAACVATATDAANCGGCGQACVADQLCQSGVCTCDGARCTGCCDGAACQVGTSDSHCGVSGAACAVCGGGRICQSGTCVCPAGQDICADACVDRQADANHCGECGRACAADETCCAGACRNLQTAFANCGACGNACPQTADICRDGVCKCGSGDACANGQTCCNGVCKTLDQDITNCGACGNACTQTANVCTGGVCKCGAGAACGSGQTCCNGICKILSQDITNCGACGLVCSSQTANVCSAGVCKCGSGPACATGQTCCNGTCRALATDFANCGTCGRVCNSFTANVCSGSTCRCGTGAECPSGYRCCNGVCRSVGTDPANCGACGFVCPGYGTPNTSVYCSSGICSVNCRGDAYDVNGSMLDGCEQVYSRINHTKADADYVGSYSCYDDEGGSFSSTMYSDARQHENLFGFDANTGSAPHWWYAYADGGACVNDPYISITMTGATSGCYRLTFISNNTQSSAVVYGGFASISLGSGSYSDDTNVHFLVEKICGTNVREAAAYTVNFHL